MRVLSVIQKSSNYYFEFIKFVQDTIMCHDNCSSFSKICFLPHFGLKFEQFSSFFNCYIKLLRITITFIAIVSIIKYMISLPYCCLSPKYFQSIHFESALFKSFSDTKLPSLISFSLISSISI